MPLATRCATPQSPPRASVHRLKARVGDDGLTYDFFRFPYFSLLQLGHTVAPADEVRGQRQCQGCGDDHPDIASGLAAHPAERALHIPERRQDDRPGRAPRRAGIRMTEISGVPAYIPMTGLDGKSGASESSQRRVPRRKSLPFSPGASVAFLKPNVVRIRWESAHGAGRDAQRKIGAMGCCGSDPNPTPVSGRDFIRDVQPEAKIMRLARAAFTDGLDRKSLNWIEHRAQALWRNDVTRVLDNPNHVTFFAADSDQDRLRW